MAEFHNELCCKMWQFQQQSQFTDLTVIVQGEQFKVHKLILASTSDYFQAMFSHDMIEATADTVELCDYVSLAGFRHLLRYAYTGELDLTEDNAQDLLSVAAFLQITTAVSHITKFLEKNMCLENCDDFASLGKQFGIISLNDAKKKVILKQFMEYSNTDAYLELDPATLADYLSSDSLKCPNEKELLKRVLVWYNHDVEGRKETIHTVLEYIRYTQDGWPCIYYADGVDPFVSNPKCEQLLMDAEKYMQDAPLRYLHQNHRNRVRSDRRTLIQIGGITYSEDYFATEPAFCDCNNYYHRDHDSWYPLGVISSYAKTSHARFAEVNGCGILVGGYLYMEEADERVFSKEVKMMLSGNASGFCLWDMPNLIVERAWHSIAVTPTNAHHDSAYLYAIGGLNNNGTLRSVERLDMHRDMWVMMPDLPHRRFQHASAAYQDKVYVSGGLVDYFNPTLKTFVCYNPVKKVWEEKAPMLTERYGHTMSQVGEQLFVCGGISARCTLSSVEMYDIKANQWTAVTPMRQERVNHAAAVLDGVLLVLGGDDSIGDIQADIQKYDVQADSWGHFGMLPFPLRNFSVITAPVIMSNDPLGDQSRCFNQALYSDEEDSQESNYWDHLNI